MKKAFPRAAALLCALAVLSVAAPASAQCVSYTGTAYSQDFNTLATSGTANVLTLPGWSMTETGGGARDNEQYAADTGSSTTGDTYSYGASSSTERAFGGLQSSSLVPSYGACFTNNTGSTITTIKITYTGEQWRLGATGRVDRLDFQLSTDATGLTAGTWVDYDSLDFTAPVTAGTVGALDGNNAANRTLKVSTLGSFSVANGASFWIRWSDINASSSDDGLAVDDFMLEPALPTLSVNDVSAFEGSSGTTTFTFTVTLSSPTAADVTFDVATADGTATLAGSDYVQVPVTSKTITAGTTTTTVDVTVNGDTNVEGDEAFDLLLSNVSTNATTIDGTGTGTIRNDDGTPSLTVSDVTANEGDVATTTFGFTVSLSWPAPVGGVAFDIATADGTATLADSDYVMNSMTGQAIPMGSSSAAFNVTVNGDLTVEPTETFYVNVTNVTGANVTDSQGLGTINNDDATPTLIHDIQGSGAASPLAGNVVTVDGIVTGSFQGASGLGGFFVQEEDAQADADPATSEAIFVASTATPVLVGDRVRATGTVLEYFSATELSPVTSVSVLGAGNPLPATVEPPIPAPVSPADDWERFEGMRVAFSQLLYVTDTFNMGKFGEVGLSSGARLPQPTNFIDPNDDPASGTSYTGSSNVAVVTAQATANSRNLITLDDGRNGTNLSPETYDPSGGTVRLGNSVTSVTGVLAYQFGLFMIEPTATSTFTSLNPRTAGPPSVEGAVRAGFMNTLNFFVNTGTGRGAANATELTRQRDKLVAALRGLGADVIGLSELEKDPTALDGSKAQNAAAQSLADGLTTATGRTWAAIVDPWLCETDGAPGCNPGTDPDIKCGIVYDATKVTPVGSSFTDLAAAVGTYSRAPYAQVFSVNATTNTFALVVNHLRSKSCSGASGAELDQGDGQGCYNARRTNQALATSAFVASSIAPTVPNILLVGDMNAYSEEDPLDAFRANGFTDLVGPETSYAFSGLSGRIDHVLGSAALVPYVTGAAVWHINADEPVVLDYVTTGKPADAPYAPDAYRSSDHDPLVAGLFGAARLYTLTPCRVIDTREPDGPLGGPAIAGGAVRTFALAGTCSIPAGATSIVANVTVVGPATDGNLRIYMADQPAPSASAINFAAGRTRANNGVFQLSLDSQQRLSIQNDAAGAVDILLDVSAYFR